MEKLIYPLWHGYDTQNAEAIAGWQARLHQQLAPALARQPWLRELKLCVVDVDVAAAAPYRMESLFHRGFDAALILWVDAVTCRAELEALLAPHAAQFYGYLVTESDQLPGYREVAKAGERTTGMNEIVFLRKPEALPYDEWLSIWQDSHTQIAIDTQSTFGYRQNVVHRALSADAPAIDAIIEENFPPAAIASRQAFYDAGDDEALYREREKIMVDSCVRFIAFDQIDCIPTSEYPIVLRS